MRDCRQRSSYLVENLHHRQSHQCQQFVFNKYNTSITITKSSNKRRHSSLADQQATADGLHRKNFNNFSNWLFNAFYADLSEFAPSAQPLKKVATQYIETHSSSKWMRQPLRHSKKIWTTPSEGIRAERNRKMFDTKWLPAACGSLAPALIPPAHMLVLAYFWENYSRYVDKHFCTCSCWDTIFKGPYESGVASYKHLYFNATQNSFKMWLLTVFAVIALYECIKQLIALILQQRCRFSMLLLFSLSIFSHYYAWWAYINYYNDDYYQQWNHQLFFTVSPVQLCICMYVGVNECKWVNLLLQVIIISENNDWISLCSRSHFHLYLSNAK